MRNLCCSFPKDIVRREGENALRIDWFVLGRDSFTTGLDAGDVEFDIYNKAESGGD